MKKRLRKKLTQRSLATKSLETRSFQSHIAIRAEDVNRDARRVTVSLSSQTDRIKFYGVPQILLHERSAVDLEPIRNVGSVLMNHDPTKIVGRPENVRLDEREGKLRADIVFAPNQAGEDALELVSGGFLRGVSAGFMVNKWQRLDEGKEWKSPGGRKFRGPADVATGWSVFELSLTPIPADAAVGVGRTNGREPERKFRMQEALKDLLVTRGMDPNATDEEAQDFILRSMSDPPVEEPKPQPEEPAPAPEPTPTPNAKLLQSDLIARERQRVSDISDLVTMWPQYREVGSRLIKEGASVEKARGEFHQLLHRDQPPKAVIARTDFGEEEGPKFRRAARDSLLLRVNRLQKDADESPTSFRQREQSARECADSMMDLMKHCLRRGHLSDRGAPEELMVRAFSNSTSDFPAILKDAAEKRLLQAYEESPSTWRPLVRIGNARDFKTLNRPKFGNMGSLVLTPDLVPMAEGSTLDVNESFAISTYTRKFGIGRQALINDDLSAFDRIPTEIGQAAARTVADTFYTILGTASGVGPTMAEDSAALFATTHTSGSNYIAAVGTPDVAGLTALKLLMRKQKGLVSTGETAPKLNIAASFLLVPAALETAALQTVNSTADPSASNDIKFNPFRALQVIVEPRLDDLTNGGTAWYLVASPNQVEGAEVAFLNGNDRPTMVTYQGTNVLGTEWGVFLDFGAKFIEHRGWARTRGA